MKFQQTTSAPSGLNHYNTNIINHTSSSLDNPEDTTQTEHQRLQDEKHASWKEISKEGKFAHSQIAAQASRTLMVATIPGQVDIGKTSKASSVNGFHRKDGPPVDSRLTGEATGDETGEQLWSNLDMGQIGLRNLGDELFAYTFLTQLYLANNLLASLPSAIGRLRLLTHLDISGNQLTQLPTEIGMLTSLRELLLFDNKIATIPAEFGTLYQLEFLGMEGNPLQDPLRTYLQNDGCVGLIHFLRDSCPVPMPPPERVWQPMLETRNTDATLASESFTVFCYNILCEKYATSNMYGYTPSWALAWEYRKELILHEITSYGADIICLQEIDVENFEHYFSPHLMEKGYAGAFWPKSRVRTMNDNERRVVDGCASFYRTSLFELIDKELVEFNQAPSLRRMDPNAKLSHEMYNRVMTKDNIAVVVMLEAKATGTRLILANAHIHWDPKFRDVKIMQVAMMMDELHNMADKFVEKPARYPREDTHKAPKYKHGEDIPLIVCGDFNSIPGSGVYEFLSRGCIERNHDDFMELDYGPYIKEGRKHAFSLKSAYSVVAELPFTNHTPVFQGVIDYVWHTTNSLEVTGLLMGVDKRYLDAVVGFPNAHFPSDHICILSEFRVKRSKDSVANEANFGESRRHTSRHA